MQPITVDRIMSEEVQCVTALSPFADVVSIMASKQISCILVCEKSQVVGIVTEREIVGVMNKMLGGAPTPEAAINVMSGPVVTIREGATVHEMMMLVEQSHLKVVVVVDGSGGLSGLVTQTDMLRAHAWDLDIAQQTVRYLLENSGRFR